MMRVEELQNRLRRRYGDNSARWPAKWNRVVRKMGGDLEPHEPVEEPQPVHKATPSQPESTEDKPHDMPPTLEDFQALPWNERRALAAAVSDTPIRNADDAEEAFKQASGKGRYARRDMRAED